MATEYTAKLRSIGVISRQTRAVVKDGCREDGVRTKTTTDELGHTVTEHNVPGDRQDVHIQMPAPVRTSVEGLRRHG